MTATATLNVRLPEKLKERGMQVLEREGVSVSELIRDLFREIERTQRIPEFSQTGRQEQRQREIERKRAALRRFAMKGRTLQSAYDDAREQDDDRTAYHAHLERKHRPGVRA